MPRPMAATAAAMQPTRAAAWTTSAGKCLFGRFRDAVHLHSTCISHRLQPRAACKSEDSTPMALAGVCSAAPLCALPQPYSRTMVPCSFAPSSRPPAAHRRRRSAAAATSGRQAGGGSSSTAAREAAVTKDYIEWAGEAGAPGCQCKHVAGLWPRCCWAGVARCGRACFD